LRKSLGVLASFARSAKIKYQDVEFNVDFSTESGLADSGDLETDLTDLLVSVGEAAQVRQKVLVLFIDELQYVPEAQLSALISALHRASQKQLPITLIAAGLPQLPGQLGLAKTYAERLFEFVHIGALDRVAARQALRVPAEQEGVLFAENAIEQVIDLTEGYPYFLQEWGKHAWSEATASPITLADVTTATEVAQAELDASFFQVRIDRLTPAEKRYMRAMAELGPGPHRSGEIAKVLGKTNSTVAPVRNRLIAKGMLYSPAHGDTAFTVPLFDRFMRRVMPDPP
jgi:hypothetical protein